MAGAGALIYNSQHILPPLYGVDKTGKDRLWKVWSDGNVLHRIQGVVDGKMQTYEKTISGRNIGKKNETSPADQAAIEADKSWVSQLTKNYTPAKDDDRGQELLDQVTAEIQKTGGHGINAAAAIGGATAKRVSKVDNFKVGAIETKITPMKANVWELNDSADVSSIPPKISSKFDWDEGVYIQPKLDGIRCAARVENGRAVLTTNNGKEFPWFADIRQEIIEFMKDNDCLDGLDGEIYAHNLVDADGTPYSFERQFSVIQSICGLSRSAPHELESQIEFHVFDFVDLSGTIPQCERFKTMKAAFAERDVKKIKIVNTALTHTIGMVGKRHDMYAADGYEGVMVRSKTCPYIQKRSLYMRKYKNFSDVEAVVIGAERDDGLGAETFVWVCKLAGVEKTFKTKPRGTAKEKIDWWEHRDTYLGRNLTIKFQNYSADGIPRFPIGIGFREDQ